MTTHSNQTHPSTDIQLSVLLVEDTSFPQRMAFELLSEAGYHVVLAATAEQAIALSKQQVFGIIYMDIGLPDGSGIDVVKAIRQDGSNPNATTFTVALTAHGEPEIKQRCYHAGFQKVIEKPLNYEKIEAARMSVLPIIDFSHMKKFTGDNVDAAKKMMGEFIGDLPQLKRAIMAAYEAKDIPLMTHHLHQLRGAVSYTGAMRLKGVSTEFDKQLLAKSGQYDRVYQSLLQEIDNAITEYQKMIG